MKKMISKIVKLCYDELERKGGDTMYGAEMLIGKEYFSKNYQQKKVDSTNSFGELWRQYTLLKKMVKDTNFDSIITKYIVKDKEIKSGMPVIKNTRISTKDIMKMTISGYESDDILRNFPSITNEKQILAALVFEIRKKSCLLTLIGYSLRK